MSKARKSSASALDPQALVHELEVHRIELEMQNEELRSARVEAESALASYTELFEFAPIRYARIAPDHTICDINHLGAQLLGKERAHLRGWRFELFVDVAQRDAFRGLLEAAKSSGSRETRDSSRHALA